MVENSGLILR